MKQASRAFLLACWLASFGFAAIAAAATYSVGPTGDYPTLTAALAVSRSEAWVLELEPAYTSASETFPINLYGNPVTIRPQAGATGLVIEGPTTPVYLGFGGGMVIDGRPGGQGTARELTIRCTSTTVPAVVFQQGSRDTLRWVHVESANAATGSGAISFVPFQLSCAYDAIQHCRIGGGGLVPANLVYLPAATVSFSTRDLGIEDCELLDWFGTSSAAVSIQSDNRNIAIRRNSFYQTAPRTISVAGRTQYAVLVNASTPNVTIEDNWFGGSAPQCGGAPWTLAGIGSFTLVLLTSDNAQPAVVRGNRARNFDLTVGGTARMIACNGNVSCEGNQIGSDAPSGGVAIHASSSPVTLVNAASADQGTVRDNHVSGVTVSATTGAFVGVNVTANLAAVTVAGNVIGGSAAGAISTSGSGLCSGLQLGGSALAACRVDSNEVSYLSRTAASSGQPMVGLRVTGSAASLDRNLVRNLTDAAETTTAPDTNTLTGIALAYTDVDALVLRRPVVHSLRSTATSSATRVCGIDLARPSGGSASLDAGFVHSLTSASADSNSRIVGVRALSDAAAGAVSVSNSMIRVGIGPDGEDAAAAARCVGASSQGEIAWIGNSIFVGGVLGDPSVGASRAMEISAGGAPTLRNNVLANERGDFAPGGRHAALLLDAFPMAGFSSDHEVLHAPIGGSSGALVVAAGTAYGTLLAWQATGQDAASLQGPPLFIAPYATAEFVNLHVLMSGDLAPPESGGATVWLGWTSDFDGEVRDGTAPDIGADEFSAPDGSGVDDTPASVAFAPARPNPVRGATTFEFALPRESHVTLAVLDVAGRRVRTLAEGGRAAGVHAVRWNATDDAGRALAPGAYLVRLSVDGGLRATRRVVVLR